MKKIILTIAITALTLTIASQVQAGPKTGGGNKSKSSGSKVQSAPKTKITSPVSQTKLNPGTAAKGKDYHLQFGTKFQQGYFYKGKNHNHWGLIRFDPRYGCDCYWDPCVLVWYYWCERDVCYYPVSYCPYRCYVCPEAVVVQPVENGQALPPSTQTTPVNDIPPIPEPLESRKE